VKYLRALTLICFSFGLFVQVVTQAAAMPLVQNQDMTDCAEMARSMPMQMDANKDSLERTGPCRDMTLDCLASMNCVPPLALNDPRSVEILQPIITAKFGTILARQLESRAIVPESPPPQISLTV
jgi:hypothetical protein